MKTSTLRRLAVGLLILLFAVSTSSCDEFSPAVDGTAEDTTVTTGEKLYREFQVDADWIVGNAIVEEVEPKQPYSNSSVFTLSPYENPIEQYDDLVICGTIVDKKEIVFRFTETGLEEDTFETNEYGSLLSIRVDQVYNGSAPADSIITVYVGFSSYRYDVELERLPDVGEQYFWILLDGQNNKSEIFRGAKIAAYSFALPANCLLSPNSSQGRIDQVIDYYRSSAKINGREIDPAVFELTDPDAFFTAYYDAVG